MVLDRCRSNANANANGFRLIERLISDTKFLE